MHSNGAFIGFDCDQVTKLRSADNIALTAIDAQGLAEVGVDIEAEESSEGLCYRLACVAEPVEEDNAEA